METVDVQVRVGTTDDIGVFQRVLYEALAWNPDESIPSIETVLDHPEVARYHHGWGRPGDIGVVAETDHTPIGGAYCRLFTKDDHGHGFVDEATPEVAIAVWSGLRGQGIGGRLLAALEHEVGRAGIRQLSLSVDKTNPAAKLYTRTGYRTIDDSGTSYRMLKALHPD